jgi:hypothetical protein
MSSKETTLIELKNKLGSTKGVPLFVLFCLLVKPIIPRLFPKHKLAFVKTAIDLEFV